MLREQSLREPSLREPSLHEQSLREQQLQFANHLRNPDLHAAPPGVEERRLQVYRQLFFNNISQLLANTFPVIRSMLDEGQWQSLVRDFYTVHRCEMPLFPFIAGEFAEYLLQEREEDPARPYLAELAQYEWSEIALRHALAEVPDEYSVHKPQLSPLCWPLVFRFPVHRIGASYQPLQVPEQPTCLLVYRAGDTVKFIESSPATFRLLQLLADDSLPDLAAVSRQLAAEMQFADLAALQTMLQETLDDLLARGVLLGRLS